MVAGASLRRSRPGSGRFNGCLSATGKVTGEAV